MDSIRKTTPENTNKQVDFGVAIANRVYDLLKERNMTQRDFAKALNKTETEVSRWLSGTHNLTLSSIAKMATVLGDDIITTTHTLRPYKIPDVEQYATSVAEEIHTYTYSCTTIDFPQRHHLARKPQVSDYQYLSYFLHIYDILKEIISV